MGTETGLSGSLDPKSRDMTMQLISQDSKNLINSNGRCDTRLKILVCLFIKLEELPDTAFRGAKVDKYSQKQSSSFISDLNMIFDFFNFTAQKSNLIPKGRDMSLGKLQGAKNFVYVIFQPPDVIFKRSSSSTSNSSGCLGTSRRHSICQK